ncbi:2-succinyl-5-enolpyruvyl-6-hydroxy-3-cyclohexene-1-carboxylate synthase [Flavobacterium bizetiae]|uniref:2-succinyl-5-enolpyruvyl-6-hydroxy-3-cyclohexene-1-carboxylate synthase n=1 Tax=Flavobacterium bizetiae TaxID=2704140 RepID=A0A6J4GZF8_9FLAO|nr:2-succinyl-5-enolpyruvyl-6-hydroxy-3-cyclohexene-1-carboxylic-acid synthase [Flavobacterium bizetiae]CAA9203596.1 2-succinyl-5-enolpyruvyl-6-hydroxy-3-cyclohexene-1-carboxylate synthase [Flavobacterium bizetiae]CAD5344874.1 2-succinyl-5-enolpyruvyl-6-hydroxy-3-cyclohexene-1-carboxylate synthase [Flavobacterium bizetiae]CAD5350826.1 2-succinyl-5-enolpyruvyl-6-hydroxy-3-cyclohexene-1-carboxylate synthase [Flavobacterium bizetiae]
MIYPKIALAQSIIEICLAKEITNIIISPGSRNAPLTIGFAQNPNFKCYSIADERCAAFFALGIAQQTKQPTAVVCTSGSALLNYYPAVAEAFYSQIPLIVISADRPQSKIDIGDGQTIRQENVFQNHSVFNANLTEEASVENDLKINKAIEAAILQKGPVHINAPFEEPLYETVSELSVEPKITHSEEILGTKIIENIEDVVTVWNTSKRKLILIGGINEANSVSSKILENFAKDPSIVVLTETTSNLHDPSFINSIDSLITPFDDFDFKELEPEVLITFGGMIVSKRIKAFLRKYKPAHHWHIDTLRAYDTFNALSKHFVMEPEDFFKELLPKTTFVSSKYFSKIDKIYDLRKIRKQEYLRKITFSDFKVFEKVIESLPKKSQLQISNSSAIRYAQLIEIDPSIEVYCNRGTSGIDGSTSTAVGAAVGRSDKQTVFITGDIGFLYDSNALWNSYIPKNFKIILINNGGGGIFRILPGHEEKPVFNTYFETSHNLTAEHLAKMYKLNYFTANDVASLEKGIENLYSNDSAAGILEVFTPTLENDAVLKQYFKELV